MYIDTHCHLDDKKFDGNIDNTINEFLSAGVGRVIDVGCNFSSSLAVKEQAEKYSCIYFAAGYHPSDIDDFNEREKLETIKLLSHKKCVAVGEIGLDYHWRKDNIERQKEGFIEQIEIAYQNKLPISIHIRDAMGDGLELLRQNKNKLIYGGVMHCFSGSVEIAKEVLKLGLYISFGGTLTFKNSKNAIEVAKMLPSDKILTETDSPYLAPEPLRGSVNSPKNIPIIVEKLAEIRGEDKEKLKEQIFDNAKRLFYKLA